MHTTPWFNALKTDPEHDGSYETYAKSEDEVKIRRWKNSRWEPAFHANDDAPHWRGAIAPEPLVEHKQRKSTLFAVSPVAREAPAKSVVSDSTSDTRASKI
jgi:hypothetical protein